MRIVVFLALLPLVVFPAIAVGADPGAKSVEKVSFNRDIQPIFSDVCFKCHGPDEDQRVSDLRLDTKDGAMADLDDYRAIVPGDLEESELYRRITSPDPEQRMPPPDSGRSLTEEQIDSLTKWIEQGASWQDHWAFIAPLRPARPKTENIDWQRNAIDDFVLARLEAEGLKPAREAAEEKLIRRVSLDLTGLPPTLEEVEAFLGDRAPNAYERMVDRLLCSPRFGERMAMEWLDAARYADTSGYQTDGPRYMWRWRDWVINSINANMPFDQFTIEQIAGDLLTEAACNDTRQIDTRQIDKQQIRSSTAWRDELVRDPIRLNRLIASGFNRNHRGNAEGGVVPEEYQVEYVVDRVDTTFTVWLGLTIGCSRCHDHKYDPFKQEEFYKVFAYFNSVPENGRAIKEGNSVPYIKAPTPQQLKQLDELDAELAAAEATVAGLNRKLVADQKQWEQTLDPSTCDDWTVTDGLLSHFALDGNLADNASDKAVGRFTTPGGAFVQGRLDQGARFNGECFVDAGDIAKFDYLDKFTLAAWVHAEAETGTVISRMTPQPQADGYYVHLEDGHIQLNLVKRWLDDSIRVQTIRKLSLNQWHHVTVTYDGSRVVEGISIYVDGLLEPVKVNQSFINQSFFVDQPLRIGGGSGPFSGVIDDVRVYDRDLSADEAAVIANPASISQIVSLPAEKRSDAQRQKLRWYYIAQHAEESIRAAYVKLQTAKKRRREFLEHLPTVMVMQELPEPRQTHVLVRGQYDKPGKRVLPGVPGIFSPLPKDAPSDRRGLARWLVDPANPLTARVAVNRFWQMYFGTGFVKTTENFGAQGQRPSHPQLLDWLATEFIRIGWDVKAMQKLIVTSATYRQSSKMSPEMLATDPENRLLARGPRIRLPAEMVRDQALAVSGLLTEKLGGPSVLPYQPEGLWKEIASDTVYNQSHGDDLYRRSLYTYWKRTVAPPTMVTLDATARESCIVKRSRTNTPLQALVLMNEVAFVESARVLAQRTMLRSDSDLDSRLRYAFRRATARNPDSSELNVLADSFHYYLREFRRDPEAADKLLSTGEFARDERLDSVELASYTMVASLLLNLDELMTKE